MSVYRVSQTCVTLYETFELRVANQLNLGIITTKVQQTFFDHLEGPDPLEGLIFSKSWLSGLRIQGSDI